MFVVLPGFIGLDCAEGEVGGRDGKVGEKVEKSGLANIGKTDDTDGKVVARSPYI